MTTVDNINKISNQQGYFMSSMILLENACSLFIAEYFCDNNEEKTDEFLHVVAYKEFFGLSAKLDVLFFIMKNHFKDELISDKKMCSDLLELRDIRNHFSHREIDLEEESMISFIHYKTKDSKMKKKIINYTNEEIKEHSIRAIQIAAKLTEITSRNEM